MITTKSYAAHNATSDLSPHTFERREPQARDVVINILFCGICHSDVHMARDEWAWAPAVYPLVPGHEIVGKVERVGSAVTHIKPGDVVGVGCLVESCKTCSSCEHGMEQFCNDAIYTYNGPDHYTGSRTMGGYSQMIVVREDFVLNIPYQFNNLAGVAPLLCAGITTYSPLKRWGITHGKKVGIMGLGGLGHMGVKIARALGAEVTLFTTSPNKRDDALRLGAHHVVISTDDNAMQQCAGSLDFILDTISNAHDINRYLALLKIDGALVLVGVPEKAFSLNADSIVAPRRILAGSLIGGIAETQEMLDFCAKHNITSDIEIIPIQDVNKAYTRMLKQDVKYRFVIDMSSLS